MLKAQHNFSTQIVSTLPNIMAYNALQILYRTLCCCIVWSSHCFFLAVVYYDSICWRYFTHALCTIYYSLNCFGLLAFFSTCGSIMRLQIPSSSSCFFDCSWWRTFLRYANSIVFLIKKNCHRSPVSDRTLRMFFIRHCMHSTTRLNFKSSLKKKLPFAVDYSLSALVYIFFPNPIVKNRLKPAQKYHFGWKKTSWVMSIHCSLRKDHICMILVNLRLHAQICPDLQTIGVDLRASITQPFLCCCWFFCAWIFLYCCYGLIHIMVWRVFATVRPRTAIFDTITAKLMIQVRWKMWNVHNNEISRCVYMRARPLFFSVVIRLQ